MNKKCIVFPTTRNIRAALSEEKDGFLPQYMSMGDFLNRAVRFEGRVIPDQDLRVLAMHEASRFEKFNALKIERNFFTFIQNSQYIFRFFEELGAEGVQIDALECADTYGEYEEHIAILKELRTQYHRLCEERQWADPIFMSEIGTLNEEFLTHFTSITIHIEGYLSRYELMLLERCTRLVEVQCCYTATPYNRKMSERFAGLGIDLKESHAYRFSLSERTILEESRFHSGADIRCEVFQNRLVQVGFVKASIEKMVNEGISPESIVVVLPDEGFARYLRMLDTEHNFNFAMGRALREHRVMEDIEAVVLFLDEASAQNRKRLERVPHELIEWMKQHYYLPFRGELIDDLVALMTKYHPDEEVVKLIEEEHYEIKHLYSAFETMEFRALFRIFMNRLKEKTIDDVRGGKITVMGLLETRGSRFDGVIVVDFNESAVPHRSQKDLFLNTKIREISSLPTSQDRESLQKHYYSMLFHRAKKVLIGCVNNGETTPSRFLMQLGIQADKAECLYEEVLFPPLTLRPRLTAEFTGEYDFTAFPLSASRLKTFLSCKRQFFYRYIQKIKEHEIPRDMSEEREIGNEIHSVLEKLYREKDHYTSAQEMRGELERIWSSTEPKDPLERHLRGYWIEKLSPFFESEIKRSHQGYRVMYREKECEAVVEGIRLVGRLDRIDQGLDGLEVIDYKTGKYPSTESEPKESDVDYQLSVYALVAQELGKVRGCAFYDLNSGELKFERFLDEKLIYLRQILGWMAKTKTWEWSMCDDLKLCRYCAYAHLCHREL